jgi:hypothetical protein
MVPLNPLTNEPVLALAGEMMDSQQVLQYLYPDEGIVLPSYPYMAILGGISVRALKGLGNPFRGRSAAEIEKMFLNKGFVRSPGPDPLAGKGAYINPRNIRSYHIDMKNRYDEPAHFDVNRLKDYRGGLNKKKYFLED